jgi:hypothetical protein
MEDDEREAESDERYGLKLGVQKGEALYYFEEHFFKDAPHRELVAMMFEEAKQTFRVLYPGEEPDDFIVKLERLRPADNFRPNFRRLVDE